MIVKKVETKGILTWFLSLSTYNDNDDSGNKLNFFF